MASPASIWSEWISALQKGTASSISGHRKLIKRMTRLLMYFSLVVAVFTCTTSAFAIHADIQPRKVFPGDAFMVRLWDIAPSQTASVFIEGAEVPLEGCGEGCALGIGAVGIDTAPGEKSVIINSGPYRLTLTLSVLTPNFPEMRLKLPQDKVSLGPEDLARAKKEEEKRSEER